MKEQRLTTFSAALICVFVVACSDGPTGPTPQVPAPLPISNSDSLEGFAGAYTLTVNVSDQCSALQDAARRRTYQASLKASRFRYLTVEIVGGGFSEPVIPGELWPSVNGQVVIDWNNFDGGCDGYREPLLDGSRLMICGTGPGALDGSTIAVTLNGNVFIEENGRQRHVCTGSHQFTFTRSSD